MSSDLEATSAILGEYMLKGWTLTDIHCPGCNTTPLMREPLRAAQAEGRGERERVEFCARCQGAPGAQRREVEVPVMRGINGVVNGHGIHGHRMDSDSEDEDEEMEGISEELERELEAFVPESYRRAVAGQDNAVASASTSTSTSLPHSAPSTIPTTSMDRDQARRTQSDQASERIGTLMLQGYTLLSTLCPNAACYAIPLVGHPRRRPAGGSQAGAAAAGQKKECVSCGKVWEADGSVSRDSVGQRGEVEASVPPNAVASGGAAPTTGAQATTTDVQGVGNETGAGAGSGAGSTIRDITRQEAMRIYAGESPAQVIGAAPREPSSSASAQVSVDAPSDTAGPAQCRSMVTDEDHSLILEDTYQALLNMLDRATKRLAGVTEGPQAAFDDCVFAGHSSRLVDTIDKLVNGLETVRKAKKSM